MQNKQKEQERADIHEVIWKVANDLRGSIDGWDFKNYVLGIMFYRFISENLSSYLNTEEHKAGEKGFNYADLDDEAAEGGRDSTVQEKGFYILPSELFANICATCENDPDLNVTLSKIFQNIEASANGAESENNIKGLFNDLDVNSNKLGSTTQSRNKKLSKLLLAINDLPIGDYNKNSIDLFGDAYEYLMGMYAANAGKSGGEYFTPQEVSELLARITTVGKTQVNKVYDPACGSGSLLLKFAKVLGKENVLNGFYGQEINLTTYNLCRINMFLHDINYEKFDIAHGDTLIDPMHQDDEPFEAIVSNPPYSIKWDVSANPSLINDDRFTAAGVLAPKSKADLAFVMHALSSLASNGTAAIVCFPGVMYRGGAEQKIRKYLVDGNFVESIIQLPQNLLFGTTIATCILVLKKHKKNNSVLFIDATAESIRGSANNKISEGHLQRILETYSERVSEEHFSKVVELEEIQRNDYNLSVGAYVQPRDDRPVVNMDELEKEITQLVKKQSQLRSKINDIVVDLVGARK